MSDLFDEFVPMPPTASEEKKAPRGRRSKPAVNIDDGESIAAKIDAKQETTKLGWNSEVEIDKPSKIGRRAVPDIPRQRKTIVQGSGSTDFIDTIPDLLDEGEDINNIAEGNSIAEAPEAINPSTIKSLADLEPDSNISLSQVQVATIPGLDLSRLIANCLLPMSEIEEIDAKWEFDALFAQAALELENT